MAQTRTNKRTGEVQEMRGGQWVTITPGRAVGPAPAFTIPGKPADPLAPGQQVIQSQTIQKNAADLSKAPLDNENARLTNEGIRLTNEGKRMDLLGGKLPEGYRLRPDGTAEPIPGIKPKGEQANVSPKERADAITGYRSAITLRRQAAEMREKFDAGPGKTSGLFGLKDYLPTAANQSLDTAGNTARGAVGQALGFTGGQLNSPQEAAQSVGPYLPKASDYDSVALDKITQLEKLADDAEARSIAILGGVPDENGNITPVQPKAPTRDESVAGLSNISAGGLSYGRTPTPTGSGTQEVFDADRSALIDRLVRRQVPYSQAVKELKRQFPDAGPIDPSVFRDAKAHNRKFPQWDGSYGFATKTREMGMVERGMNTIAQSAPGAFLGSYGNAATAGIPARLAGDQGQYALATWEQEHAPSAFAGNLAGNVTGMYFGGKAVGGLAKAGSTLPLLGRLAGSPGGQALTADLAYGSIYGANQSPDDPLTGAVIGAGLAAGGSTLGRYVLGPGIRAAGETAPVRSLIDVTSRKFGGGGFNPAPALPGGQRALVNVVDEAGTEVVMDRLAEAADFGLPYTLADADPALRRLAGSVSRKSPQMGTLAENTFGPRQRGQAERAIGAIDRDLAPIADIDAIKSGATRRAQDASRPLYASAYNQPAPYDQALDNMLRTPAGEAAAREAYAMALNSGRNPGELSFEVDSITGAPRITGNPNWQTLHYMKMGLDSVVEKARDPVTGKLNRADPGIRALDDLRGRFVQRMGDINPDYKKANAEYARFAGQGSAAEQGYKATAPRVRPEQVETAIGAVGENNLPFYRQGYATSLADTVERTRLSGDPYEAIYGSTGQQAKLGSIFPEGAERFGRQRALEADMSKTYTEALGGSQTQPRAIADQMFDSNALGNTAFEVGVSAATGVPPVGVIQRGVGTLLRDMRELGVGKAAQRKAEEIGPILFDTNPAITGKTLKDAVEQARLRQQYIDLSRRVGGSMGAGLTLPLLSSR